MSLYPIFIDIKYRRCIVIGGGKVAYRKIKTLLTYGPIIEVVGTKIIQQIKDMNLKDRIIIKEKMYETKDIIGAWMVFAATDNKDVNESVAKDAHRLGIMVNCSDDINNSSFITPGILKDGDFSIAISTNGKFPKLSQKIKKELQDQYSDKYGLILDSLESLRQKALKEITDESVRKRLFERIIQNDIIQIAFNQSIKDFDKKILEIFEGYHNEENNHTRLTRESIGFKTDGMGDI